VDQSKLKFKEKIEMILKKSAARDLTMLDLEKTDV
jgi:hypothetical protein